MFLDKRPNHTKSEPIGLRACISYPNALLLAQSAFVNITKVNKSYQVVCHSCKLTNCITSAEPKDLNVLLVVRRPPFVMLPVELGNDPWYDNSALQVLNMLRDLVRPRRFVAKIILGITALISILTTFAVATTALVQGIHTAHYVNALIRTLRLRCWNRQRLTVNWRQKLMY